MKTHSIVSRCLRCVTGPENILFAGASVHLSARNFTGWGSEGVNVKAVGCPRPGLWRFAAEAHPSFFSSVLAPGIRSGHSVR